VCFALCLHAQSKNKNFLFWVLCHWLGVNSMLNQEEAAGGTSSLVSCERGGGGPKGRHVAAKRVCPQKARTFAILCTCERRDEEADGHEGR
jgi:hypothetical protein